MDGIDFIFSNSKFNLRFVPLVYDLLEFLLMNPRSLL